MSIFCIITHFFLGFLCFLTPSPMQNHRKLARIFIKLIAWSMRMEVNAIGLDNLPSNRSFLILANHSSLIDIMVLMIVMPVHFNFVSKRELFWVPFIGLDQYFEGDFFIDRKNKKQAKKCMLKVDKAVRNGRNILIFPEGTRSKSNDLLPFKKGGFKLAKSTGAPIVPCYIHGSASIVKKNTLSATPGQVDVHFLPPLTPTDELSHHDLLNQTFQSIQRKKESLNK